LKAEHLARAARHLERSGDPGGALSLAVQAQVHAPSSPAISFTLERLLSCHGSLTELANLRGRQIEAAVIDPVLGNFDIGILARYRTGDPERAAAAFRAAADEAGDE